MTPIEQGPCDPDLNGARQVRFIWRPAVAVVRRIDRDRRTGGGSVGGRFGGTNTRVAREGWRHGQSGLNCSFSRCSAGGT